MTKITNEMIYGVLKSIQERLTNLEDSQREVRQELVAIRGHLNAMQTDIANLYIGQSKIETRLERIER